MKKVYKITLVIILLFLNAIFTFSQNHQKCKKCKALIQQNHLNRFTDSPPKIKLIEDNWSEHFFANLENKLFDRSAYPINSITLKFDGLGCIYPDRDENFEGKQKIVNVFENKNITQYDKLSFFKVSENTKPETADIFWKNYVGIDKKEIIKIEKPLQKEYIYQATFRKQWNEYFLKEKIKQINDIIIEKDIERIVFLSHGYNVPYSLAQIQNENIIDKFKATSSTEKTLFLNIIWPSTSAKKITEELQRFYFKNKISLSTKRDFKFVVLRTYGVAVALRNILNQLEFNGEYSFFAHSLGTNVVTTTLIDPIKKLKIGYRENPLRDQFRKDFEENPLKINPINVKVFLNAPAIGGIATFSDLDSLNSFHKKINWTIGYNPDDNVLNRKLWIFKLKEKGDNTRLGGNRFNEVENTRELITKTGFKANFIIEKSGRQNDLMGHDFFCYIIQNEFSKLFSNFAQNTTNNLISSNK